MQTLILATNNQSKLRELSALLSPISCISQETLGISSPEETGLSFIENALIKARHASQHGHQPALADDSGLVVPSLDGRPGIYSARFAGTQATDDQNIDRLLNELARVTRNARDAYFYCAIALVQHALDPTPMIAIGKLYGKILYEKRGTQGFGYDPVFFLEDYACTMAELPMTVKNKISHRGHALHQLQKQLAVI